MNWQNIETLDTEASQELMNWADEKSQSDCTLPEECCGGGNYGAN